MSVAHVHDLVDCQELLRTLKQKGQETYEPNPQYFMEKFADVHHALFLSRVASSTAQGVALFVQLRDSNAKHYRR